MRPTAPAPHVPVNLPVDAVVFEAPALVDPALPHADVIPRPVRGSRELVLTLSPR